MQCPNCRFENPDDARFCAECGAGLEQACPACGASVQSGQKFCRNCGHKLAAGAPTRAASDTEAPAGASPDSYTPKHLAERILNSRSALEGERKQVSILFADIKGSMELIEGSDPEEARKILDVAVAAMMDAVHRYEGTVNKVLGDGIMALFGAPLAHEDHAVRACYAALAMQQAIGAYAEEARRAHGVEVQVRVGLHSGEVVVRAIGNDLSMDYDAIGPTVHLASRMEQLAVPGTIRLTADTLGLAEGFVEVKSLGPVPVKGLSDQVDVFDLTGAAATRSRLQAAVARGLTRFVGRDTEIETVGRALEQAGDSHGQIVALVGEPGVGKSRLFYEFTRSHRTEGWLILQSSSVSYGKATSWLPVIDLLKSYFGISDHDDGRSKRERVTGKLLTLDEALKPVLPAFVTLFDVPVEDGEWQGLAPQQRRRRTLDAVKALFLKESEIQPLIVVFEDLHWTDSETRVLLDSLVESLPTSRILLLVNYRPEFKHGWGGRTWYTQLRIDPLPAQSAEEILAALLGDGQGLAALKRLLLERAEGNPLFLEESVRRLVEVGTLVGERGAYTLSREIGEIEVPASVQAIIAARIDRLGPREKGLLQTAAVIGHDVHYSILRAVAEVPEEDLHRGLAELQTGEFLYETRLFPDLEYTFKHALTHQVAYGGLLQERRRALHARVAETIEDLYPDRLTELAEGLAGHFERGEVWEKATTCFLLAAEKAKQQYAYENASDFAQKALQAAEKATGLDEERKQALVLLDDVAIGPSNVFSVWLNINAALVFAAEELTSDPTFVAELEATSSTEFTGKVPANVLKRVVEFRNKLDLLRTKNGLEPTNVYVDPSGKEVTPALVYVNSGHVLDSLVNFVLSVLRKGDLLVGKYYKDHGPIGKKPSDVFGLVDLADRRLDQLLCRLNV
ncbi:MAG: adenylate/guanylate cyclase domain-containing protein [Alphaproteobacteria bacterium]